MYQHNMFIIRILIAGNLNNLRTQFETFIINTFLFFNYDLFQNI